jgi:hypothetical protein
MLIHISGSTINEEQSQTRTPQRPPPRTPSHKGLYGLLRPRVIDSDGDSNSSRSNFDQLSDEDEKRRPSGKGVRERVSSIIRRSSHHKTPTISSNDEPQAPSPEMPSIVFPTSESESSPTKAGKERRRVPSMLHKITHPVRQLERLSMLEGFC